MASLAYRLYRLEHRLAGQPAERWVRDALLAAGRDEATPEPEQRSTPTSVRGDTMGDKQNAARVAWATIRLSQVGQRPVSLDQLAAHVGLPAAETARLLRLTRQERVGLRDGMIRRDATPSGPRRFRVHAGGRPVGAGKGCSVDMYLLALVNLDADLTPGLDRIDADVCAQQPFFASAPAASRWLADHPQGRLIAVRSFHAEARRLVDRLEAAPPATPLP